MNRSIFPARAAALTTALMALPGANLLAQASPAELVQRGVQIVNLPTVHAEGVVAAPWADVERAAR